MSILTCQRCGKQVSRTGPKQRFCPACSIAARQEYAAQYAARKQNERRAAWEAKHPGEPYPWRKKVTVLPPAGGQGSAGLAKPPTIGEISRVARYFGVSYGELVAALERAQK